MTANHSRDNLNDAAILLLSLHPDQASSIISHMDDHELIQIGKRMSDMRKIAPDDIESAAMKYLELHFSDDPLIKAGRGKLTTLLQGSFDADRVGKIITGIDAPPTLTIWDKLAGIEPDLFATQISEEQPQTIALILCKIDSKIASKVLEQLPEAKQGAIVECMSKITTISDDLIQDIEQAMEDDFEKFSPNHGPEFDGINKAVDVLKSLKKESSKAILLELQKINAELFSQVDNLILTFDDLVDLANKDMQTILKHISTDELVRSLKGATDEVRNRFLDNMSQRAGEMMREDIEVLPPMKLADIEASQREILKVIRKLDDDGTISLNSGDLV